MMEAGWDANARDPSSGAAGIPQDITGNMHGGAAGRSPGCSTTSPAAMGHR